MMKFFYLLHDAIKLYGHTPNLAAETEEPMNLCSLLDPINSNNEDERDRTVQHQKRLAIFLQLS